MIDEIWKKRLNYEAKNGKCPVSITIDVASWIDLKDETVNKFERHTAPCNLEEQKIFGINIKVTNNKKRRIECMPRRKRYRKNRTYQSEYQCVFYDYPQITIPSLSMRMTTSA